MKKYMGKDFYKLLGISPDAEMDSIKSAYRKLAKVYHPDANKGNKASEDKFKELTEAYEILCDEKKRKQYDILNGFFNADKTSSNQSKQAVKAQAKKAYQEEKEIVEGKSQKPFSDILDGFWKKNPSKPQPQKGSDITIDVEVTPEEALKGVIKQINIMYLQTCPKCSKSPAPDCVLCGGTNEIPKQEKVKVKIPPKVQNGTKIRIKKEGNKGKYGGENGDLYLIIKLQRAEKFTYNGSDILYELPVTPSEAALGATADIQLKDGNLVVKIPPETSSGQKLKISGQGLKDSKGTKGDLIITLKIVVPKKLSPKEKDLYKELASQRKFNPREQKNG